MKEALAERLLVRIMNWDYEAVDEKLPPILFMSSLKYDDYDNFFPGTRFLGSLSRWLYQFEDSEQKEKMLSFVTERLVFISSSQMSYLITLLYNTKILPSIIDDVAVATGDNKYHIRRIQNTDAFKKHKRMSLFIGLSDGAHMDIIRRTSGLNNEQVLNNYYPDNDKVEELQKKLDETDFLLEGEKHFETLFLIDDFTASGTSFIRKKDDVFKGKIVKVFNNLFGLHPGDKDGNRDNSHSNLKKLFRNKIKIKILFCITTKKALKRIHDGIEQYISENPSINDTWDITWGVDYVQLIDDDVSNGVLNDSELLKIIMKNEYCNPADYTKESFQAGAHKQYWLGFDECALPIVLSHNTPNNSLLTLWQTETEKIKSLFPRISRH